MSFKIPFFCISVTANSTSRVTDNLITITVGENHKAEKFLIHDFLLKEHSKFFEAALNGPWKEGREKKLNLPDDEPDVFGAYVEYLFTGKIATATETTADKISEPVITSEFRFQAKLYVLGEKLLDDKFCDCTLRAMGELCKTRTAGGARYYPNASTVSIIYKGTASASPMRKFLVHLYCRHVKSDWLTDDRAECYPQQFFVDIAKEGLPLLNRRGEDPEDKVDPYFKCK